MLSRSALLAFAATIANAAILFIAAHFFNPQSDTTYTCQAVAYSVLLVGLLWSATLAIRSLRKGEPRLVPIALLCAIHLIPFICGIALWYDLPRYGFTDWRFELFLPVLLPFPLIATGMSLLILKLFRKKLSSTRSRTIVATAIVLVLALILLPAPAYFLSVVCDTSVHRAVLQYTPNIYRDPAEKYVAKFPNEWYYRHDMLLRNGFASEGRLTEVMTTSNDLNLAEAALIGLSKVNPSTFSKHAAELYLRGSHWSGQPSYWFLEPARIVNIAKQNGSPQQWNEFCIAALNDISVAHADVLLELGRLPLNPALFSALENAVIENHTCGERALELLFKWNSDDRLMVLSKKILDGVGVAPQVALAKLSVRRTAIFCEVLRHNSPDSCRAALSQFSSSSYLNITPGSTREIAELLLKKLDDPDITQRRGASHSIYRLSQYIESRVIVPEVYHVLSPELSSELAHETTSENQTFARQKQLLSAWLEKNKEPETK